MAYNYGDDYDPTRYDADLPEQQGPGGGVAPPPAAVAPPPASAAPTPNPTQPVDDATSQTILRWIMFGMKPQDAVAKFNRDFGRTSGNEAVYYPASVHGKETIGLPDDYLSLESNGWGITKRVPEGPKSGHGNLSGDTRQYDDDWFSQNTPAPTSFNNIERPGYLQGPYVPKEWTETFVAPTEADLRNDPGFLASEQAMQRGLERSAAAKGSILSGGFAGRALPRALGEHAGNAYKDLVGRAFDTYQSRYGAHMGNEALKAGARGINEGAYQTDVTNNQNTYKNRYTAYRDTIGDSFDLARMGLDAALGSRY